MSEQLYSPEFVKELFNRMSGSYERMNYITSFGFSIKWRREFLKDLANFKYEVKIIDLLTGMGETWSGIAKKYPRSTLTALDFSPGMIKRAQRKNGLYFYNKVNLVQQDILQSQLPDNHYDIVLCAFGLKTFDQRQMQVLAKETYRILKPGGAFSFIEVSRPGNKVLALLYGFYLGKVIPVLGRLFLGNPREYKMLWQYTAKFKNASAAQGIFKNAGLESTYRSYFYGCATGFYGTK